MKDAKGHGSDPRGTHASGILNATKQVVLRPQAIAHVLQNPGGGSVSPKGKIPGSGYMVSQSGRTRFVSESDLADPVKSKAILQQYATENSDVLSKSGSHIGWWKDEKGTTHLDVSNNIKNRNKAISSGVSRNQKAIWDLNKNREIATGGTGDV